MSAANRVCKTATCCGSHRRDADKAVLVPRPTTREPHHFPNVVNTDIERPTNASFRSRILAVGPRHVLFKGNSTRPYMGAVVSLKQSDPLVIELPPGRMTGRIKSV